MSQIENYRRKYSAEELAFWEDLAAEIMSQSEHWRTFYHNRTELRTAKKRGILDEDDIALLQMDLMEWAN